MAVFQGWVMKWSGRVLVGEHPEHKRASFADVMRGRGTVWTYQLVDPQGDLLVENECADETAGRIAVEAVVVAEGGRIGAQLQLLPSRVENARRRDAGIRAIRLRLAEGHVLDSAEAQLLLSEIEVLRQELRERGCDLLQDRPLHGLQGGRS